ncbi:uncharacterized protein LOC141903192 isoform X2 [Tubulanus polymorphus]|uniref:uncharacterized protein LOC141903192 isoform X2 n=1 Tax=Tubulanus polymorphus TaxID=672921 RepID=UPI003DA3FA4C
MAFVANCKKFDANIFNKNKCGVCFRSKHEHSAAALECAKAARKVTKCGYLFIAPDISARRWQRRFFVLYDDGELSYSVDENVGTVPQGVLDMNVCDDVFDAEEISGHQFSIAIVLPQKTDYIKASCKEEINRWYDVLIMYPRSNATKRKRTLPATPVQRSESTGALSTRSVITPKTRNISETGLDSHQTGLDSCHTNHIQTAITNNHSTQDKSNITTRRKLNSDSGVGYTQQSGSSRESESQSPMKSTAKSSTPTSYRNVRSLKHKSDSGYQDSLRKSNSFTDLRTDGGESVSSVPSDIRKSWDDGLDAVDATTRRDSRGRFSSLPMTRSSAGNSVVASSDNDIVVQTRFGFSKIANLENLTGMKRSNSDRHSRVRSADASDKSRTTEKNRGIRSFSVDSGSIAAFTNKSKKEPHSPRHSPDNDEDIAYMKKGWLYKQNRHSQEWTKHWFVLGGSILKYYRDSRDEDANHIEGRIDLTSLQDVKELEISKNYGFSVKTKNGVYVLSAMTYGIRTNWLQALMKCCENSNRSSSPRSSEKPRSARRSLPTVGPKTSPNDSDETSRRNTVTVDWKPTDTDRPLLRMYPPKNSKYKTTTNSQQQNSNAVHKSSVDEENGNENNEETVVATSNSRPDSDSRQHRFTKRADSTSSPLNHHSQSHDDLSTSSSNPDENGLHNPSPIEKKLNKLRSKIPRVRSPPPPSTRIITDVEENLEVESLQGQLEQAQKELITLHEENSMLKSQMKNRQQKSNEDSKNLLERCGSLEDKVKIMDKQNSINGSAKLELELELEEVIRENMSLKKRFEESSPSSGEIDRTRNDALIKDAKRWKRKYEEREDELIQLQQKMEEQRVESRKKKKQIKDLELESEDLKSKFSEKSRENERLKNRIKDFESQIDELSEKSFEESQSTRDKDEEISNLRSDFETLRKDYADMMNKYNDLSTEYQQIKDELREQNATSHSQDDLCEQLQTELQSRKQECENLSIDLMQVTQKYESLLSDHDDLKVTLKDSLQILDSQKKANDYKDERIENGNELLEKKCAEHEDLLNRYDDLTSEFEDLKLKLIATETQLRNEEHENKKNECEVEQLTESLKEKCCEFDELSDELMQVKTALGLSQDSEALLDDLDAKEDELEQIKDELEVEKYDHNELKSKYNDLLVELDATKVALQVAQEVKQTAETSDEGSKDVVSNITQVDKENVHTIDYSDHVDQIHSLTREIRIAQDKSDELELRNSTLIHQTRAIVEKYQDEVKSYGARIDDLVKKLRTAQLAKLNATKLKKLSQRSLNAESEQVESELQEVERKIEQVENELMLQENATDELKVQLGSVERQVTEQNQQQPSDDLLLSPRSDASFVTVSEGIGSVEIPNDGESLPDDWNEHHMVTRIQGLHEKVAQSNDKLREVLSLLEEDERENEEDTSNEKQFAFEERIKNYESKMNNLKRIIDTNNCDKLETIICRLSTTRFIIEKNVELDELLHACKHGLQQISSQLEIQHSTGINTREILNTVHKQTDAAIQTVKQSQTKSIEQLELLQSIENPVNAQLDSDSQNSVDFAASNSTGERDVESNEDVLSSLQISYENERVESRKILQQEISRSYASYEDIVSESSEACLKWNDDEKDKLLLDLNRANEKIERLEQLVEELKDSATGDSNMTTSQQCVNQFNTNTAAAATAATDSPLYSQILADSLNKEIQNNAIVKEYQDKLLHLREQQMLEFQNFNSRMKSIEDYLNNMTVVSPEMPKLYGTQVFDSNSCAELNHTIHKDLKARGARLSQSSFDSGILSSNQFQEQDENWLYMQSSTLAAKAMAQAELTYRITKIRDGLVNSRSVDEYLNILEQELSLALTKLQNREKLMHEILTAFRRKKLRDIASIIISNESLRDQTIGSQLEQTVSENLVLTNIRQLVIELAGFYRTLDTVGDTVDIHSRLDNHVQTEIDRVCKDLKHELTNVSSSSAAIDTNESVVVFTEETVTTMLYNLADSLAQSAVVAAQSSHLSDIKTDLMEGFERSLGNESIDSMTFPNELEFSPQSSPRGDQISLEDDQSTKHNSQELDSDYPVFSDIDNNSKVTADELPERISRRSESVSSIKSDKQSSPRRTSIPSDKRPDSSSKSAVQKKRSKADSITKRTASPLKRNLAKSEPNLTGKKPGTSPHRGVSATPGSPATRKPAKSRTRSLTPGSKRSSMSSNLDSSGSRSPFINKPCLSSSPVKRPASLRPPKLPPKQPIKLSPKKNEDRIFASFSLSHGPSSFDYNQSPFHHSNS